jgi:hypothetical protein
MYSWKVSLAARGEEQVGLGFKTAVVDVLAASPLGDTARLEGAEVVGTDEVFVLAFFRVAELGLVEVKVDAGMVDVDVAEETLSPDADVGDGPSPELSSLAEVVAAAPSSATEVVAAEPSSPVDVVAAEPSSPIDVVAAEESDPSSAELAPESSPEPGLDVDVGLTLRVEDEDFFTATPLAKVPATEVDTLVPLFETPDTLVPTLVVDEADGVLDPEDLVELLADAPPLADVADEVFAVSLLHATPIQRRVDELGTRVDTVVFADVLNEKGFNVRWLQGYRPQ